MTQFMVLYYGFLVFIFNKTPSRMQDEAESQPYSFTAIKAFTVAEIRA